MEIERIRRTKINLNIAPLIDVVFLLLIFFMLSSRFVVHPGIKLTLPGAASAKLQHEERVIIYITKDNGLYLNGESVSLENLPDRLKKEIREIPEKTVIIKADEKIDLGLAVRVMDIAKQAQAKGLVISTRAEEYDKR